MVSRSIKNPTILLIEDDPADQALITMRVESVWPESKIIKVDGVTAAYEVAKENKIDLFLVDLDLPDGFGAQTVKSIREFSKNSPIVVISGTENESVINKASEFGAIKVIDKYVVMEERFIDLLKDVC